MPDDKAQTTAGRGVLYIAFAKFYFMFAGLIVQFRLPAVLSRVAWGGYSTINSLISPVNNVLVTGTIQAVSRFSAQEPDKARAVQNAGMRMHLRFGLPLAVRLHRRGAARRLARARLVDRRAADPRAA